MTLLMLVVILIELAVFLEVFKFWLDEAGGEERITEIVEALVNRLIGKEDDGK